MGKASIDKLPSMLLTSKPEHPIKFYSISQNHHKFICCFKMDSQITMDMCNMALILKTLHLTKTRLQSTSLCIAGLQ